ncbi:hypothetical protein QE152_g210 [Popillia japonica]|uniref:Cholinephosphotransferase 1 n=1 Tax=Popillia japonica TaxID=7064 RepID=A0AAW1NBV4_POPJA
MGIQLVSAIFGPPIWSTKFFSDTFTLWYIIPILTFVCGLWSLQNMLIVIFTGGVGKNGSTVAGTSVLSPIIPFSAVLVPAFIIYRKSVENIYEEHPALYILAFGMVAAKVTNRLVVAHMTKSEMDYMDWSLLGPTMLFLNQYFNTFIPEYYVLWLCMLWVAADLLRYSYQICSEICDHLRIELFTIPYLGGPQRNVPPRITPPQATQTEKNGYLIPDIQDNEDIIPLLGSNAEI